MTDASSFSVLGFRPHTYWTAVVALAGEPDAPRLVERRRIVFAAGDERFVYHQAAEMETSRAEARIADVRAASEAKAARGVAELAAALLDAGLGVRLAVVPAGRGKEPRSLADVVKSHALIHAAEGDFYRDVVTRACADLGLDVSRVVERDLLWEASKTLRIESTVLESRLKAMGLAAGPPWSEDQRLATLAAWIGLADLLA